MKIYVLFCDYIMYSNFFHNRMVGSNLIIPGGTRIIDATSMLVIPGNIIFNLFIQNILLLIASIFVYSIALVLNISLV